MKADPSSAAFRAPRRRRVIVLARLRAERGDTLIEVIIGALMVALIATATLGGFADIGHLSASQRDEQQANALAEQDQARMRGLTITQLSSNSASGTTTGNTTYNVTIDNTVYAVTSKAQFISGSSGSAACTGTSSSADIVQTTSTVTWTTAQATHNPLVVLHGEITPNEGGAIVAAVTDPTGAGLAGVTVSESGPTSTSPVITDSSGCVVWAGLESGTYTISYTPPVPGTWITPTGAAPTSQTVNVTATQTTHSTLTLGMAAGIQASFTTTYNGATVPATSDTFVLTNSGMIPTPLVLGTDSSPTVNSYVGTLTTPTSYYPWPSTNLSNQYFAWAGGCQADEPSPAPAGFSITAGQTNNPVTIAEPAMIILPHSGTAGAPTLVNTPAAYDDDDPPLVYSVSGSTHQWTQTNVSGDYQGGETDSNTTGATMKLTLPLGTTSVTWIGTETTITGIAKVSIDGGTATSIDTYKGTTQQQASIYTSPALSATATHTLTITVNGTKNASSTGTYISIDEIAYSVQTSTPTYTQGPLLTTAPHVIVTDTGCGTNKDYPPTSVPTATRGALTNPGMPDGNYTVCVDDGSNHVTVTAFQNINLAAGNVLTANIYPGSGGIGTYGTGVCT